MFPAQIHRGCPFEDEQLRVLGLTTSEHVRLELSTCVTFVLFIKYVLCFFFVGITYKLKVRGKGIDPTS